MTARAGRRRPTLRATTGAFLVAALLLSPPPVRADENAIRSACDLYIATSMKYREAVADGAEPATLESLLAQLQAEKARWMELQKAGAGNFPANVPAAPAAEAPGSDANPAPAGAAPATPPEPPVSAFAESSDVPGMRRPQDPPAEIPVAPVTGVDALPGRQTIVDATVNGDRIRAYLIGTFKESTRFMIGTPAAEPPPVLPGQCVGAGASFGFGFEPHRAVADVHVRAPLPAGIREEDLVITLYNDRRHIPLEVTQITSDPDHPAARPTMNIRVSKEILNGEMHAVGALKSGVVTVSRATGLATANASARLAAGLYRYDGGWSQVADLAGVPATAGRTILLLHGVLSNVQRMAKVADALAAANYDVYGLNYDFYQLIETSEIDLVATLKRLAARAGGPVLVVAHSMGGIVARAALKDGAAPFVSKLVLLATPNDGGRDVTKVQESFLGLQFPPLSFVKKWPSGLSQLLKTTDAGARLYATLNADWGRVPVPYYGLIHKEDEWVSEASFEIFRRPAGHEAPANGPWAAEKGNFHLLDNNDFQNTANASDAHGSSHKSEAAIRKTLEFLKK